MCIVDYFPKKFRWYYPILRFDRDLGIFSTPTRDGSFLALFQFRKSRDHLVWQAALVMLVNWQNTERIRQIFWISNNDWNTRHPKRGGNISLVDCGDKSRTKLFVYLQRKAKNISIVKDGLTLFDRLFWAHMTSILICKADLKSFFSQTEFGI